jgi:hypothetical protein
MRTMQVAPHEADHSLSFEVDGKRYVAWLSPMVSTSPSETQSLS